VTAGLEYLERYARPFGDARGGDTQRSLEEFISDGVGFQVELEMVVHGELEAHEVSNRGLKRWMRECQHRERKLGALMLGIGTPQHVAAYLVLSRAEREAKAQATRQESDERRRLAEQQPDAPDRTRAAQCPDCGRRFATRAGRDEHRAAKHRPQRNAQSSKPKRKPTRVSRAASPTATKPASHDNVAIVVPGGPGLYSPPRIRERLIELMASGKTRIVLDLSGSFDDELNFSGLADIVRSHGGTLALVVPETVIKVFRITRLDERIPVFTSRDDAIAALSLLSES
jgi:anti-sigma B factor antagonist